MERRTRDKRLWLLVALMLLATACASSPATDTADAEGDGNGDPGAEAEPEPEPEVEYPTKPITWVIPYGAGGGWDAFNNHVLPAIQELVPQPINIVHMPGGGATVGHAHVAEQDADGYTLIGGDPGSSIVSSLIQDVGYKPDDFDPIARLGIFGLAYIVPEDSPFENLEDFIDEAKARPGEIVYGATGPTTTDRIAMLLLQEEAGIELRAVPYSGSGEVLFATNSKEVEIGSTTTGAAFDADQNLDVRVLATTLPDKSVSGSAAQYDSVVEYGYDEAAFVGYRAMMAPKGVPQAVLDFWEGVMEQLAEDEELAQKVAENGEIWAPLGPAAFTEFFDRTTTSVEPLIDKLEL